jgi:phenylpyruvate tautomerase PptA (4-oxalocrotonate tautomerase family)
MERKIGMPSYNVTCVEGRLDASQKSQIAEAISRAHGDVTGAPNYFVQVTLNEVKPSNYFLGGTQLSRDQIFVHGFIRDGRPIEMKDALISRLASDVALASQMKTNCVWVYLSEIPPNQMIEFGRVLPLHGKEAEWSAALPDAEKARLEGIGIRGEVPV